MILLIVFCVVFLGTNAKPEVDHEIQADLMQAAHDVLESMLYAKEHSHMARSSEEDEESSEEANDEDAPLNWEMYSALDDGIGVTHEYFQSFMVAEMADILLEAPLSDEVESDEPAPVTKRFFCGSCFVKYKACKEVCFGLVAVSADHAIDIIPCATTCLQRLSACCVARRDWSSKNKGQTESHWSSKNKGQIGSHSHKNKGQLSGIAGTADAIIAQVQGAGLGGTSGKFGQAQGIFGGTSGKFGQAQGIFGGPSGKFGQAQGIFGGTSGKFGQAQGAFGGTSDKFGQAQGIFASTSDKFGQGLSVSSDKLGQAQGAIIAGNQGKLGQAQAVIQSGDIGNIKGTGAVFGQANLFGVNIGQVPNLNFEGLPDKIQAIFGSVSKGTSTHTISDIPLASLSESTKTLAAAYPPTQQVEAPLAVTSASTTSEYAIPTSVHPLTTENPATSVHTKPIEYHLTGEHSSSVVSPPVIKY